jgi:hypothetical protein
MIPPVEFPRAKKGQGEPWPFPFQVLLPAAPDQPQLKRLPGRGAQDEAAPLSPALGPPQENADSIRWGFAAPHLGQVIFENLSETP